MPDEQDGADTARSAAKMVDYPTHHLDLAPGRPSVRTWLLLAGLVALGGVVGAVTYLEVARRLA